MNGVPVKCLWDSGSEVTTITESYFKEHFKDQQVYDINWLDLSAANGLSIPIEGVLIVDIVVNDKIYKDMYVLIVRDPDSSDLRERKKLIPGVI